VARAITTLFVETEEAETRARPMFRKQTIVDFTGNDAVGARGGAK
jgi:hypothetical protein